jgi:hypothetical protein
MTIIEIKAEIIKSYINWKSLDDDDINIAEIIESGVLNMISNYCESQGYEVEGFPFEKRILGETDPNYDEDYFCYWRYIKYVDVLSAQYDDVLDLCLYYSHVFWPHIEYTPESYRKQINEYIRVNIYDVEF